MKTEEMKRIEEELEKPFSSNELEWVVSSTWANGSKGIIAPYLSARAVMKRLDEVFGVAGWSVSYRVIEGVGVICSLKAKVGDEWIVKEDGSGFTKVEPFKGGISGALKRAAILFRIGRKLYELPTVFVDLEDKKFKGKVVGLPDEFVPEDERQGLSEVKIEYTSRLRRESLQMRSRLLWSTSFMTTSTTAVRRWARYGTIA